MSATPARSPRRRWNYVKSSGVGDTVFFGPEAEFFIFDDVKWNTAPNDTCYSYDSTELPVNSAKSYEEGNMGHRPGPRAATSRSTPWTAPRTCAAKCWR